jgi:hypothetical protein
LLDIARANLIFEQPDAVVLRKPLQLDWKSLGQDISKQHLVKSAGGDNRRAAPPAREELPDACGMTCIIQDNKQALLGGQLKVPRPSVLQAWRNGFIGSL